MDFNIGSYCVLATHLENHSFQTILHSYTDCLPRSISVSSQQCGWWADHVPWGHRSLYASLRKKSRDDKLSRESSRIDSASPARRTDLRLSVSVGSSIINEGNCGIKAWRDRWSDC